MVVTPVNEQELAQVTELPYVDPGYTGEETATAAAMHGTELQVVKLPEAKCGFVLLPGHRVAERSFALAAHFRQLAKDRERLPSSHLPPRPSNGSILKTSTNRGFSATLLEVWPKTS